MSFVLIEVRQPARTALVVAVRESLEIGRDCDGLLVIDPEISRRHVMVQCEGDVVTVTDLGSTNGTTVNGRRIDGPTAVTEADVVRFGTTELELLRRGSAAGDEDHMTAVAAGAPRGTLVTGSDAAVVRGRADATAARRTSIDVVAAAVGAEHPNAARLTADGGTITIVFSDIESSTEMAVALGDAQWMGLLRKHNEIIRKHVKNHRGTEIKSQGDGFMLSFPSARAAVLAMIDIQRDLTVYAAEHPETAIRIRIGAHTGEAIVDAEGDLFGKHIILAARIANISNGGQILVSQITREIASSRGDLPFGEAQEVSLKGLEGVFQVYEVKWSDFPVVSS